MITEKYITGSLEAITASKNPDVINVWIHGNDTYISYDDRVKKEPKEILVTKTSLKRKSRTSQEK